MKYLSILGVVLIIGGAYALLEGGVITSRRNVLEVGGMRVSASQETPILPWVAGTAMAIGGVLFVLGATRRN